MSGSKPRQTQPTSSSPRSFNRHLRQAATRRRRATGSGVRYQVSFLVVFYLPGVAFGTWQGLTAPISAAPPLRWPGGIALLIAGIAAIGWAATVAGPISASPEWRGWLLSTPLDRGLLLRRRTATALLLSLVPGMVVGALIADGTGLRKIGALTVMVAAAFGAVTACALAIRRQRHSTLQASLRRWRISVIAALLLAAPLDLIEVGVPRLLALWIVVAVSGVVAAVAVIAGVATVGRIPVTAMTSGTGSVASLLTAVQEQSLAPLASLLATPDSGRRGRATTRPLTGIGQKALGAIDRRRALRNRPALTRWAVMAAMPYLTWRLTEGIGWARPAMAVVTTLAAVAAVSGLCTTVRQFASNPSLADRYGLDRAASKRTAMAVPYLGALTFGGVTAPALLAQTSPILALIVPVAALAVVEYRAGQPPYEPTYLIGQQYPVDLSRRFLKGPAQLAGVVAGAALIAANIGRVSR